MKKRAVPLYFLLICALFVTFTAMYKKTVCTGQKHEIKQKTYILEGLNHNINDEMSDLPQTKQMEKVITRFMSQWEIIGASLAIMKDGKLIYSKGFGYADQEQRIRTEVKHIFRIASVSKLITATAIMKLCEDGQLKLNDKVFGEDGILCDSMFTQNIRDKRIRNITVEQLLRHRAGFSIRAGDPLFTPLEVARRMNVEPPIDLNTMVSYAANSYLRVNPGSSNIYSNLGYVVLTKVIEKVTGTNYESYVKDSLLIPLGIGDMHIGHTFYADKRPNEVKYYEPSDVEPVRPFDGRASLEHRCYGACDLQVLSGAGGWIASPTEILKFVSAIDDRTPSPKILSNASIRYMTTKLKDQYPIGWMRVSERGDWWRTGTLSGSSAMLKRQKDGFTWIFITNTSSWSGSRFPSKIETMMRQALNKVKEWPDRDLFLSKAQNSEEYPL